MEFFPEEGKYHLDRHRACGVRFNLAETIAHDGRCPACGNRVTVGVAHRVEKLADRTETDAPPPPTAGAVTSLVPLPEILAEIVGSGVASQGVARAYDRTTARLGPDFTVLQDVPVEDIRRLDPLLGEAVTRLRAGTVIREAGYDGQSTRSNSLRFGAFLCMSRSAHRTTLGFDAFGAMPRQSKAVRCTQS